MPATAIAKNAMLAALDTAISHVGALTRQAGKAVTGVTSTDTFTSTAHGYANGDLVIFAATTGGSGIKAGTANDADGAADPFFVIGQTANTFQVSRTPGGSAVDLGSDMTAGTVHRLVEVSGGAPAYARKAIAFNAPVDGTMDDSTNGAVLDIPAGGQVDYVSHHSAVTAGDLEAIRRVTQETYGSQGTYTVTDSDFDLNA